MAVCFLSVEITLTQGMLHNYTTDSDILGYVESGQDHVCVQSATLDTSIYGSMFPVRRDNPYSRYVT